MIRKKPIKGETLAVRWVEFLAEHKELPNLEPESVNMSLVEYFLIDVFAALILGFILVLYAVYRISYLYYWWCCQTFVTGKRKTE